MIGQEYPFLHLNKWKVIYIYLRVQQLQMFEDVAVIRGSDRVDGRKTQP